MRWALWTLVLLGCQEPASIAELYEACDPSVLPVQAGRLTQQQMARTVSDVLGLDVDTLGGPTLWAEDYTVGRFTNHRMGKGFPVTVVQPAISAAEVIVDAALDPRSVTSRAMLMPCPSSQRPVSRACVLEGLWPVARRLLGHTPTPEQTRWLHAVIDTAPSPEEGLRRALHVLLASPDLLMIEELPGPDRALDPLELAHRLSLTVWGMSPDLSLLDCAESGELAPQATGSCGLPQQTQRLLADERSRFLTEDFVMQWLRLTEVTAQETGTVSPDPWPTILDAMREELHWTIQQSLHQHAPVHDVLYRETTWVNEVLAAHYGLPQPTAPLGGEVSSSEHPGGIILSGLAMVATADPHRTHPIRRGSWVLDTLICLEQGQPPPGITPLQSTTPEEAAVELASIRADDGCAVCHDRIDPLGLALEDRGPLGRSRAVVLPPQTLMDGEDVQGSVELAQHLADQRSTTRCLTEHMMAWAIQREHAISDECLVATATDTLRAREGTLADLVASMTQLPPFLRRSGGGAPPGEPTTPPRPDALTRDISAHDSVILTLEALAVLLQQAVGTEDAELLEQYMDALPPRSTTDP